MDFLSWDTFEPHLSRVHACLLDLGGSFDVRIGFAPDRGRIFAHVPLRNVTDIPRGRWAELEVNIINDDKAVFLELSSASREVFREFHSFVVLFAEEMERREGAVAESFELAIRRWRQLAAQKTLLTAEQQLGLYAELTLVKALLLAYGPAALDAWVASDNSVSQRHDFRINQVDLEIKATRGTTRRHYIHGLTQLAPIDERRLFILSFRLEPAGFGAGSSLCDRIASIRALIQGDTRALALFEAKIEAAGYSAVDAPQYTEALLLSDSPRLIEIDHTFPRLVPSTIALSVPAEHVHRIEQVTYLLNVEGLGHEHGSPQFSEILGQLLLESE